MSAIDLSVVVTAHSEDLLLRPTLRSVTRAIQEAIKAGVNSMLLIVADRPTPLVQAELRKWSTSAPIPLRVLETDHGEPGAARNAGINAAEGRYIALCDGDDLITADFFVTAVRLLRERGDRVIVHPERVVSFGARRMIWHVASTDDPAIGYRDLLSANLWPSCSIGARSAYLEIPYPELPPGSGYGPEDYYWNVLTASAGIAHITAQDSIHFYRTRDSGGVNNANSVTLLPAFDLNSLRVGFPRARPSSPPRRPNIKNWVVGTSGRVYRRLRPVSRLAPYSWRRPLYLRLREMKDRIQGIDRDPFADPAVLDRVREVSEIEPAISWTAAEMGRLSNWVPPDDGYSGVLESLWDDLHQHSDVMILAPWVGVGGADTVVLNYAKQFARVAELDHRVALLTTADPARTRSYLIPPQVRHQQVDLQYRRMSDRRQRKLLAQLLVLLRPRLLLSINCFDLTNALVEYGAQITENSDAYLSLFAFDRIDEGFPVNPITDDARREYLPRIAGIITDNSITARLVEDILALPAEKIKVHHQPSMDIVPEFDTVVQYTAAYDDTEFTRKTPFRIVWPHRLDREKRPDTLVHIVRRLRELELPVEVHLHGSTVLHGDQEEYRPTLRRLGVIDHGGYEGGLLALPTEQYHCLLLTSQSEGLPLVLVQSMLLGLPVVASSVGGVVDIVSDGETGLLTNGPEDIDGFVTAIERLIESRELRRSLIRNAYDRAIAQHSPRSFGHTVNEDFGYIWANGATV